MRCTYDQDLLLNNARDAITNYPTGFRDGNQQTGDQRLGFCYERVKLHGN